MMLKALSDYRRHCHCSRSNPAITVGMPKNQLEFHSKRRTKMTVISIVTKVSATTRFALAFPPSHSAVLGHLA